MSRHTPRATPKEEDLAAKVRMLTLRVKALEDSLRKRGFKAIDLSVDPEPLILARKAVGWSQRDVAAALGLSPNMVNYWERRKLKILPWRALQLVEMFKANGADPPNFQMPSEDDWADE
jgi:DNA-binding transcriptional regulator YiaG